MIEKFCGRSAIIISMLILPGCETTGTSPGNSLALIMPGAPVAEAGETRTQLDSDVSDYRRTVREGAMYGATFGAAAGATIASQGDNADTGDVLAGALVGGLVGGVMGGLAGRQMAERKARQVRIEDTLDAEIAAIQSRNDQLFSLAQTANRLVEERRLAYATLQQDDTSQRQAFRNLVGRDIGTIDEAIDSAEDDITYLLALRGQYLNTEGQEVLDVQLAAAQQNADQLRASKSELEDMRENV